MITSCAAFGVIPVRVYAHPVEGRWEVNGTPCCLFSGVQHGFEASSLLWPSLGAAPTSSLRAQPQQLEAMSGGEKCIVVFILFLLGSVCTDCCAHKESTCTASTIIRRYGDGRHAYLGHGIYPIQSGRTGALDVCHFSSRLKVSSLAFKQH